MYLSKETTLSLMQILLRKAQNQSDSAAFHSGSSSRAKSLLDLVVNIARAVLPIIPSSHA
jgi:hypothetical protein